MVKKMNPILEWDASEWRDASKSAALQHCGNYVCSLHCMCRMQGLFGIYVSVLVSDLAQCPSPFVDPKENLTLS